MDIGHKPVKTKAASRGTLSGRKRICRPLPGRCVWPECYRLDANEAGPQPLPTIGSSSQRRGQFLFGWTTGITDILTRAFTLAIAVYHVKLRFSRLHWRRTSVFNNGATLVLPRHLRVCWWVARGWHTWWSLWKQLWCDLKLTFFNTCAWYNL